MKTLLEILLLADQHLKSKGFVHSRRQAEELIADALGTSRMQLYMEHDRPLTEKELQTCREYLARRAKGEPVAYIHGNVEFHDCQLTVSPDVLIPRQETGILVDMIIRQLKGQDLSQKILADVCCGSGCIGLALKKAFPELSIILTDLSPKALAIAKKNAEANQLEVDFREGNLLEPLDVSIDFLVCNPPYVSESEYEALDREVHAFEPKLALVAKENGLACYRQLAETLKKHVKPSGFAWFEMGYTQGNSVKEIFEKNDLIGEVKQDWSGHDRFFFLKW